MSALALGTASLVALLHLGFFYMETLGWKTMARRLGRSAEYAETTRVLALNQGFYNAGLAGLLIWALATGAQATVIAVLVTIIAMALVGALSVSGRIFIVQGVPAVVALGAALLV